jgi:hypothetical protein
MVEQAVPRCKRCNRYASATGPRVGPSGRDMAKVERWLIWEQYWRKVEGAQE